MLRAGRRAQLAVGALSWGMLAALAYLAAGYGVLCAVFWFFQHYFFFRPELLPATFTYRYDHPFEELHFDMPDGGYVNALLFRVPRALGVVYYLKGNSRSLKGWGQFARDFIGNGYDFFIMDYRGFGKSRGRRSEATLYADAQAAYEWLKARYGEERIVVYGRSLGSGIAARVAADNRPRMLILDCPYYSFRYQIGRFGWWLPLRWLLRYQMRTDRYIGRVACPIVLLHGTRDRLISFAQSEMLVRASGGRARLIPIEGAHHNNLPSFQAYHDHLHALLMEAAGKRPIQE